MRSGLRRKTLGSLAAMAAWHWANLWTKVQECVRLGGALTAMLYLIDLIKDWVRGLEDLTDRLEVDAMLAQQRLVFFKAVNEFPLVRLLFTSARWLRRHNFALNPSLDAVRTRLILIAPNLALLTKNTAMAPGELHGRVVCQGDLTLAGKCSQIRGRRGCHGEYLRTFSSLSLQLQSQLASFTSRSRETRLGLQ